MLITLKGKKKYAASKLSGFVWTGYFLRQLVSDLNENLQTQNGRQQPSVYTYQNIWIETIVSQRLFDTL